MEWIPLDHTNIPCKNQKYVDLRLYAPESEKILLDFNPLKISEVPDWIPLWEEWHCYPTPLRIYLQDYEKLLIKYFNRIFPTVDAVDGTPEDYFDQCSIFWIGENDWLKFINEIEKDKSSFTNEETSFYQSLISWIKEALKYTKIIVVKGNR